MKLVTKKQMREIENIALQKYLIPEAILMEYAGKALSEKCLKLNKERVIILAGAGNNGGDGLVAARHLINANILVDVFIFKSPTSSISRKNLDILQRMGANINQACNTKLLVSCLDKAEIVIDAIFGTGFTGKLEGIYERVVKLINESDKFIIAADIPSGVDADTGVVDNLSVKADCTLSFGYGKIGLFLNEGSQKAGKVEIVDISLPKDIDADTVVKTYLLESSLVKETLPKRSELGHKYDFGHVLAIGGNHSMQGAISLTAKAALKSGAGLVTLTSAKAALNSSKFVDEIMTLGLEDNNLGFLSNLSYEGIKNILSKASVIAIGPGMGKENETKEFLRKIIKNCTKPLVVDADGLSLLGKVLREDPKFLDDHSSPIIMTPHIGELSKLTGLSIDKILINKVDVLKKYAKLWNSILVLKGPSTLISTPESDTYILNNSNSGMATAGSGDVLTGFISGFLAQNSSPLKATLLGVYLHSIAGLLAKEELTEFSMIASDIISYLPQALKQLLDY